MIEVQDGNNTRQRFGITEPSEAIFRGVARNGAGFYHGIPYCFHTQVRSARRALAMPEIHSDTQSAVTLEFDGFYFTETSRNAEAFVYAGISRSQRRALARRLLQHKFDYVLV